LCFFIFVDVILAGDGPNGANKSALTDLLFQCTPNEIISLRMMDKEWNKVICDLLSTKVKTLLLFSDEQSKQDYDFFVETTGLKEMKDFSLSKQDTPFPN